VAPRQPFAFADCAPGRYGPNMDLKKLSDESLRQKLRIATFDSKNHPEPEAKRDAAKLLTDLQKEIERRSKPSRRPTVVLTRKLRKVLDRDWR
jgi:hypothetical protein